MIYSVSWLRTFYWGLFWGFPHVWFACTFSLSAWGVSEYGFGALESGSALVLCR